MTHKRVLIEARTIDGRVIHFDGGIECDHPDDVFYGCELDNIKRALDITSGAKSQSVDVENK